MPAAPAGEVTVTGDLQASENTGTDGVDTAGGLPDGQLGMISAASLVNLVPYDVYDAWVTLQDTRRERRRRGRCAAPVPAVAPQGSGLDLKAFQNLGYTGEWFVFAALRALHVVPAGPPRGGGRAGRAAGPRPRGGRERGRGQRADASTSSA